VLRIPALAKILCNFPAVHLLMLLEWKKRALFQGATLNRWNTILVQLQLKTATMPLPQDIANLLAVAERDVIWFKDRVYDFFKFNGIPAVILKEIKRMQQDKVPTIKIVHHVLGELEKFGDTGNLTTKKMLTTMRYWKDLQSIEPDRKAKAEASLQALTRMRRLPQRTGFSGTSRA
jgi:hypothetical protein